jgi:hypothetical protein
MRFNSNEGCFYHLSGSHNDFMKDALNRVLFENHQ